MTAIRVLGGDPAATRGLHLGDGLFETLLVAEGRACFLAEHLARLRASATALSFPLPAALDEFVACETPALWQEVGHPVRAVLRISVSRGPWTGLEPSEDAAPCCVLALREAPPRRTEVDAVLLDAPRIDPASPLAGHKVLSWMDKVEARRRARAAGAAAALLRTIDGDVAEADSANVFVATGDVVVTPPLLRGVLPGITRSRVMAASRALGLPCEERRVEAGDLDAASEVFLTSSLAGIVSLRRLDSRALAETTWASRLRPLVRPEGDGGG